MLAKLSPAQVTADTLAGEPVTAVLTEAPGNGAAIGGIKVTTDNAWFAARPSGTEDVYKVYAESFLGPDHLRRVQEEAKAMVSAALERLSTERRPAGLWDGSDSPAVPRRYAVIAPSRASTTSAASGSELGPEPGHDLAFRRDQELLEVPAHVARLPLASGASSAPRTAGGGRRR